MITVMEVATDSISDSLSNYYSHDIPVKVFADQFIDDVKTAQKSSAFNDMETNKITKDLDQLKKIVNEAKQKQHMPQTAKMPQMQTSQMLHSPHMPPHMPPQMPQGVLPDIMRHSTFSRSDDRDITTAFIHQGVLGPIFSFFALSEVEEIRKSGSGSLWLCLMGWLSKMPKSIDKHGNCANCYDYCVAFTVHEEEQSDDNKLEFRITAQ
jgi:hypothetical protein